MQGLEVTGPAESTKLLFSPDGQLPGSDAPSVEAFSTAANSAAIAEAGSLSWMSHRPKVPSTLKSLEGVEVSFLLSL